MTRTMIGKPIIAGSAEGVALVSAEPLSFWGGYDPKTGEMTTRPLYDGTVFHRVIPQFMIQEHACTRASLTVHEGDIITREVRKSADRQWIAPWNHQALFALHEMDQQDRYTGEVPGHVGGVVGSILRIEEMRTGQMAPAVLHCHDARQTPYVAR